MKTSTINVRVDGQTGAHVTGRNRSVRSLVVKVLIGRNLDPSGPWQAFDRAGNVVRYDQTIAAAGIRDGDTITISRPAGVGA